MNAVKELLSKARAAVDKYDMIPRNACVAVGVSGGKDSLCALYALARLSQFHPSNFTVKAISVDMFFNNQPTDFSAVTRFCTELGVEHIVRPTQLYHVVFEENDPTNPCSLCALMRRGVIHAQSKEAGCDVLALGHHADDEAQTVMMNLFRGGRFGGLAPKTYLDRRDITVIRPLLFCSEDLCSRVTAALELPVVKSGCPVDGNTERARVEMVMEQLRREYPDIKKNLTGAARRLRDGT